MKHDRQRGFSIIIVVVGVAILAIAALAGWSVWSKNQKTEPAKSTTTQQTTSTPTSQNKSTAQPEVDKYLVIKEWGVRITLPEQLRGDVSYFMNDLATVRSGGPTLVSFVSKKFSAGDFRCAEIENVPRSLVSIDREVDDEGGETIDPPPFKRINSARFYLFNTSCEETVKREGTTQDKQLIADLKQAVSSTLEKIE